MINNLSLRIKLILAFAVVAALMTGVSVYQIKTIEHTHALFQNIVGSDLEQLNALQEIKLLTSRIPHDSLHRETIGVTPEARVAAGKAYLQNRLDEIKASRESFVKRAQSDPSFKEDVGKINVIVNDIEVFVQQGKAVVELRERRPPVDLGPQHALIDGVAATLNTNIDNLLQDERSKIIKKQGVIQGTVINLTNTGAFAAVGAAGVALAFGLMIALFITRSLEKLKNGAERIANGDFSKEIAIKTRDEIGQLAGTFNQMSERLKDSYQRLALEKRRDEALLKGMSEGLVAVDKDGVIVLINKVALDLLDLPDENSAVGKSIYSVFNLYGSEDKAIPVGGAPVRIAFSTGQAVNSIFGIHKKTGKRLVNVSANPITLEGKVEGAIVVLRDVTKEREIDRMKTEFISLASHQLRTPLSAIKWFTEMLLSGDAGKLTDEQQEFARNVSDSTERMIELVNSLLNISRIESGRIIVDPKPTDLKDLVSGIVNDLKAKTADKAQTLIISVHKDLPKINLDPRLISQVYLNLLTNAIKYTPKGGEITVFISKKGEEVISQVADTGYGIPKEEQAKIFQKFFRADNIVKIETDGTGLGLYLVKAIVESSGGRIWFESSEGKGTSFWFTIPLSGMKAKEGEVTLDS